MTQTSNGHRFNADNQIGRLRTYFRYDNRIGQSYTASHIISYSDIGHPGFVSNPSYRKSRRLSQYFQIHGFYSLKYGLSMSHSIFVNDFKTDYYLRDNYPEDYVDTLKTNYGDIAMGYRTEMLITKLSRWIIMIGTDIDWSRSNVSTFNPIYESPIQLSIGGFLQSKFYMGNGWNLGMGVRYDYRRSDPGNHFQQRNFTQWSPKINIVHTKKDEGKFSLLYSEGFRAPSLSELYLEYRSYYGLIHKGNPEVTSEKVRSIEMTYEYQLNKSWFANVSMFHNRYGNMIDFVYSAPVLAVNRVGVIGSGLEIQLKWDPNQKFILTGGYSYLDMIDRAGDPILYRSNHRIQCNVTYQSTLMKIQLGIQAWSKQNYEDFLNDNDNDPFDYPIRELPARALPELVFSKEINTLKGSIRLSNLFDTQYELIQDYPMPGRIWQATLTKILN